MLQAIILNWSRKMLLESRSVVGFILALCIGMPTGHAVTVVVESSLDTGSVADDGSLTISGGHFVNSSGVITIDTQLLNLTPIYNSNLTSAGLFRITPIGTTGFINSGTINTSTNGVLTLLNPWSPGELTVSLDPDSIQILPPPPLLPAKLPPPSLPPAKLPPPPKPTPPTIGSVVNISGTTVILTGGGATGEIKIVEDTVQPPPPGAAAIKATVSNHQSWEGVDLQAINPNWDTYTEVVVAPPPPADPGAGILDGIWGPITPTGWINSTGGTVAFDGGLTISGGVGGTFGTLILTDPPPPPPVELLSSSRSVQASAHATVRAYDDTFAADNSNSDADSTPGILDNQFAIIANVFDDHGPANFLAGGEALASQISDITDTRMTATGSVSSESGLDTGVPDADANTTAVSRYSSSFRLNETHDFTLDLEVSATEDVSLAVSLTDDTNDEVLYSFIPADQEEETGSWEIFVEGYLPPGEYTLSAEALSDNAISSSGDIDLGGDAAFDLDFNLYHVASRAESVFLLSSVPEPATALILVVGGLVLVTRRRMAC